MVAAISFAHARIVKIDSSRAQKISGVKAVITGKDVSPRLEGVTLLDKPVLAQDRVRYRLVPGLW